MVQNVGESKWTVRRFRGNGEKSQIGENLEAEMIPMEHSEKHDNKPVAVIKATPCPYVENLVEHSTAFVDENAKLVHSAPTGVYFLYKVCVSLIYKSSPLLIYYII